MMRRILISAVLAVFAISTAGPAEARTKLTALPDRGETYIRLDNPEATLIEEERVLTLQEGLNRIDFSWAGVSIDPDSIRLTPLSHPDQVTLLNVSFPPGESALVWEIASKAAVEEKVRISYLLSYIDRLITYKLVADKDETKVDLRSFVVLRNFSGEDFEMAKVLLDYGEGFEAAIRHEETRQVLFLSKEDVPIEKVWTFDSAVLPWDPAEVQDNVGIPVGYRIENSAEKKLGENALWDGKVRVYQDDGHGGTIVLGEDNLPLVPVGDDEKVYIGDSRDLVVTQRKMQEKRINVRRNRDNDVVLYDTDEILKAEIENFKDKPAVLTVIEYIDGQWNMIETNMKYERKDHRTLEYKIELPARGKTVLNLHYNRRNIRQ